MEKLVFKSYHDLVNDVRKNLSFLSEFKFDLVVGIPRSGMVPAYLVAAYLNIDCCDVDALIDNRVLQRGVTRSSRFQLKFPQDARNILLIDDSIYSGGSLQVILDKIPNDLKKRIKTAVVYASGEGKKKVDFYLQSLDGKKLFEWGLFHNNLIDKTCFDMDGVLCEDCRPEDSDDGERYMSFIQNARPLFLPSHKIHTIITNRLEKYRPQTEKWLRDNGVEYGQLIMLNLPSKAERNKIDAGVDHKGHHFKALKDTVLFIESSLNQSKSIALVAGKPVYCVDVNQFIEPSLNTVILKNSRGLFLSRYYAIKHKIKMLLLGNI